MNKPSAGASGRAVAGDLLDVNVWLALAIEEHPHHRQAASYWSGRGRNAVFFCRLSAMSFVRLLMNPKLMADKPLTLRAAWASYVAFAGLPGVAMLGEPADLDSELAALLRPKLPSRLFTDAYFAALARRTPARLVTFDRDFERFDGLALLRLSTNDH